MKTLARWARRFGLARAVCTVLLLALVPLRVLDPPPLQELRVRTFDLFQALRPREQTIRPVAIVDIDEASLKEIGQWPWPRTVVADLITRLKEQGALVIGFDVIFAEPDRMSPAVAAESFRGLDDETRTKLSTLPSNDDVLADAIKHARVVVGQTGSPTPQPRSNAEMALQTGFAFKGPDPTPFLVTFPGLLRNVLPIEQAAAGRGLFSINPERDGIVRRVPLVMEAQGVLVPSLSLEMLRVLSQTGAIMVHVDPAGDGVQSVAIRGLEIPTDERGQIFVHFNKSDPARYVSAKDVLQGKLSTDRLRGKLVLIGTSAIGSSIPRSPRATMTTSAARMISSAASTAWGFSILATSGRRVCPRTDITSSAVRTNDSATTSTPIDSPNRNISRSSSGTAASPRLEPGMFSPCREATEPPISTAVSTSPSPARTAVTRRRMAPSAR